MNVLSNFKKSSEEESKQMLRIDGIVRKQGKLVSMESVSGRWFIATISK